MQSATHTASDPEGPIPLFTEISNRHSLPKEKQLLCRASYKNYLNI